jgi:hypothetical protein
MGERTVRAYDRRQVAEGTLSFDVFLQCFKGGEPAGIPRVVVRPLFPVDESRSEPDYWCVCYDDLNSCHISVYSLPSDPLLLESLCVFRPCGDLRLWEALLAVLRLGSVVLYFPGNAPPLVASKAAGEQLPADMVEAVGQPRVVTSGKEIVEIIKQA